MPASKLPVTVTVLHHVPTGGETFYADVVRVEAEGHPWAFQLPGTRYCAARAGEPPTHYPAVPNGRGSCGFVVLGTETVPPPTSAP